MLRHSSQICVEMSVDLLADRNICTRFLGCFVCAINATNAIRRLTLRRMLTQSLELKFMCENVAFVIDNKYTYHICA